MTDQPGISEPTDEYDRLNRRTMLKGVVAGLAGTAATGTASATKNTITLEAGELPAEYRIKVSGKIWKGKEAGGTDRINGHDVAVGMMKKTNEIDDTKDSFEFTGQILDLDVLMGSLSRVWINGERVHPDDLDKLDATEATVLEDFEDGKWPGDWQGEIKGYDITDEPIVGTFSLEADGPIGFPNVRKSGADTPRGHTYTVWTVPSSDRVMPTLLTNVQGLGSIMDNCYTASLDVGRDKLLLKVRSNGRENTLAVVSTDRPLELGKKYMIALDVGPDWVRAQAFASDETQIAATDKYTDTTHHGGTPGLYTGGREISGTKYDQYTRWPLGSL